MTRRGFLAALAAAKWDDQRLGVFCGLGKDETTARRTLEAARAAGFRRAQIFFPWTEVDEAFLRALPGWLDDSGVRAEVLGAYVNCLSPGTVIMSCREEHFARAIDLAATLGCRHLAAWTGGYAPGLMESDARNFAPEASDAIGRFLGRYTRRLEDARLTLALETYITLACPDAPSLRRLLDRLPRCVGAVLDPPNLTPVARYAERDQVLREMVDLLKDRVAVVHLKDFTLAEDGRSYKLPGPLKGAMNYPLFIERILSLPGSPPLVAEHLALVEFAEARRALLPLFARIR